MLADVTPTRTDAGTGASAPARRGRPLDADRTPAILDAVLELLVQKGYDQLRVQDVAEHAGVGLGTIYRRWPTKQALVIEALRCGRGAEDKIVDTGNPSADLIATFTKIATAMREQADMVGFIASMRSDPEVADTFRCMSVEPMRAHLRALIASARGVELDDPALDILTDLGPAIMMFRLTLVGDESSPEDLALEIVRVILDHPTPDAR
jgi:AcrR family transcriptional regulator